MQISTIRNEGIHHKWIIFEKHKVGDILKMIKTKLHNGVKEMAYKMFGLFVCDFKHCPKKDLKMSHA
jgi:hypothetical protein